MTVLRLLFILSCWICSARAGPKLVYLESQKPEFEEFVKAIQANGQLTNLENKNIQTVVVPTNAAWLAAKAAGAFTDATIKSCIQTHFLSGDAYSNAKLQGSLNPQRQMLPAITKRGGQVYFNKFNDTYYVDHAKLVGAEWVDTVQGLPTAIRGIDKVLCPFFPTKMFIPEQNQDSYLKQNDGLIFNSLLVAFEANKPSAPLASQITDGGTFFVPTDTSLSNIDVKPYLDEVLTELIKKENVDKLEKVLETHIIKERFIAASFLETGKEYTTFNSGRPLKISIRPATGDQKEKVVVHSGDTEAVVIKADQLIGNGNVFTIDAILALKYKNNYAEIMTNGHTVKFKELIAEADSSIKTVLKDGTKNFTIFAVDNLGLDNNNKVTKLRQEETKLTKALEMAIVPGQLLNLDNLKAMDGQKLTTLNGDVDVKVANGEVTIVGGGVNGRIVKSDYGTTNGVVHILDQMLSVGSTSVYDLISQDPNLSDIKKLFDDFGMSESLKDVAGITVIATDNTALSDARKADPKLENLLKDTSITTNAYKKDMDMFLSMFILDGTPVVGVGMKMAELKTHKAPKRTVKFDGTDLSGVTLAYLSSKVTLQVPYMRTGQNGQLVVAKGVLYNKLDIKTGQTIGAASTKLHTGLALAFMVFILKFWW